MKHGSRLRLSATALIGAAALLVLAACSYTVKGTAYEPPEPAAEISGTNYDGAPFKLSDLRGKVVLIFFGYTNCPDVCPTTLAEMRVLYEQLGAKAGDVAVVFVSVDPERDRVEQLAKYIPAFNPKFYGVHMDPDVLEQAKKAYGVFAEKRPYAQGESAAGYSVDHTARLYGVDPQGHLAISFAYGTPVEDIRADVEHLLKGNVD